MASRREPPDDVATTREEEVVERRAGPPPERYWWVWLLLLLLLVVGGLLLWWLLTRGDDKATVPNVIGLRAPVATERIRDENLESLPRSGGSNRPAGVVFAQRPGAGTQLDEGQTVTISISSGRLAVPDVTGMPVDDAQRQLSDAGFESQVTRVASSRPKGVVVEQDPTAGVTAVRGTTVKLNVSSGAKPVVVPQVVGQTQGDAVAAVTKVGLKPALQNVGSSQSAGTVVAQKPAAGKEVDKGSKVTLNISTGTPSTTTVATTTTVPGATTTASSQVTVPTVTGLFQAPALRRLNALRLRPVVVYQQSSQTANRILSQSPSASSSVARGSRVRVVVSTGPNPQPATAVPNVVGQEQAAAAEALRSAGFRVLVLNRPTSNESQDGQVVEQQPVAGSNIPGRSLVTIFIGRFTQ
jgi:beta-lactam-binding protein with PASTA domain